MRSLLLFPFLLVSAAGADVPWLDDAVIQKARRAAAAVHTDNQRIINGFFASPDGLVVTTAASLEGSKKISVITHAGEEIQNVGLMAYDPETNIAVLATGKPSPDFLAPAEQPPKAGEPCAVLIDGGKTVADGVLLAYRQSLHFTGTRFIELWSIGLNPKMDGLTGAAVISRAGKIVGMCNTVQHSSGEVPQKFVLALPEKAVFAALERASAAVQPVSFPRPNEISGQGFPNDLPSYFEGMRLLNLGDHAAALSSFRTALQQLPDHPLIMMQVAGCLHETGDPEGALTMLQNLTKLHPERLQARLFLSTLISRLRSSDKAIEELQKLTTDHPLFGQAWGVLGENLNNVGRKEEAWAAVKKFTELEPDCIDAWRCYALALDAVGKTAEATLARERFEELESLFFKLKYATPKRD